MVDRERRIFPAIGSGFFVLASIGGPPAAADPPALSVAGAAILEGNRGTAKLAFPVTLSAPSAEPVTAAWTIRNGTAVARLDYVATSGTLTFRGVTSQTIVVEVQGDFLDEPDENFLVELSKPAGATLTTPTAVGVILDDDEAPGLSIDDAAVHEGKSGTALLVFHASLSAPSGRAVSVEYAVRGETAESGADFVAAAGKLAFPPGTTLQRISVAVKGDVVEESEETLVVELLNPEGATLADPRGEGTLRNGEAPAAAPPQVYYGDPEEYERPAEVDAARVFNEIPEWQEIQKKSLNPDQAEYWILLEKANQKFYGAVQRVAQRLRHDLIGERNTLPRNRGEIPDVTDQALGAVER